MPMNQDAYENFYLNAGSPFIFGTDAYENFYLSADASQPNPFIYGATSSKVRVGDYTEIVGRGIGQTSDQYIPRLEGQQDDGTWVGISYTTFTYVPPSANAYNASRTISSSMSTVDTSHTKLGFVVPEWSTTPHMPVRITASVTGVEGYVARQAFESFYVNVAS